jgi:hypothetical protein
MNEAFLNDMREKAFKTTIHPPLHMTRVEAERFWFTVGWEKAIATAKFLLARAIQDEVKAKAPKPGCFASGPKLEGDSFTKECLGCPHLSPCDAAFGCGGHDDCKKKEG